MNNTTTIVSLTGDASTDKVVASSPMPNKPVNAAAIVVPILAVLISVGVVLGVLYMRRRR